MDLNESLRAVVADPPPTRIDLDALIRGEQRREYRQRWVSGAGVVSGIAVLVGAAGVILPGGSRSPVADDGAPPCPWVSPSVYPGEMTSDMPPPSVSQSPYASTPESLSPPASASTPPYVSTPPFESTPPSVSPPSLAGSGSPSTDASPPSAGGEPVNSPAAGQPPPPVSASAPAEPPSAGPAGSPSELCGDTLRRLEHVLTDALARIAPNAHLATPVRFFNHPDGMVRADVVFADRGVLTVALLPLWAGPYERFKSSFFDGNGQAFEIGTPMRGLVGMRSATGGLTADQLHALADEPGLTLEP